MASTLSLTFTATPIPANTKLIVEATRQVSPGVTFMPRSEFRQIKVIAPAATSPQALATEYVARFGALVAGKKIFLRLTQIGSTGGRSAPITTSAIVT